MATLRKRKSKKGYMYVIDFYYNNKRYTKSTKTSGYKTAKKILENIQGKIAQGTFGLTVEKKKSITLEKFFAEYFEYAESYKRPTTIRNKKSMAEKFAISMGDVELRGIDIQKLDKWKITLLKNVSHATFNIHQRFLQAAFNIALKWKYLETNPFKEVRKETVDEHRNFFTEDEIAKLFNELDNDINNPQKHHIRATNTLFKQYVEFLINTGLRRNEALFLTSEHVDFDKKLIYIQQTKEKKYRPIPLNQKALEILKELGNDLFSKLNPDMVTHKFGDILKRIGLSHLKLHSLRHTFATRLVSLGVGIYAVKEFLGHQDIRTSMVYAKADTGMLQEAVDKLNN